MKHASNPKKTSDIVNIEKLAEDFKLPEWEDVEKLNIDNIMEAGGYARDEALKEGESEEQAEEAAQKAQDEARDELYRNWHDAVENVAEDLFETHNLTLVPKSAAPSYEFKVEPTKTWTEAAESIIDTINGVGMFEFKSVKEFLDSGPYTLREAVLSHLHWIKRYPEVYGEPSPRRMYERAWR